MLHPKARNVVTGNGSSMCWRAVAIRVATFPATFATGDDVGHVELIAAVEDIFDA
jgi:hypothetical protein